MNRRMQLGEPAPNPEPPWQDQAMLNLQSWIRQLSRRIKVIVVDDERDMLDIMQHLLQRYNCDIDLCNKSTSAVDLILKNNYDLGFIDLKMSPMDGMAIIKEVQKARPDFKFVIITGYSHDDHLAQRIQELGRAIVLSKPITQEDLDAILGCLKI